MDGGGAHDATNGGGARGSSKRLAARSPVSNAGKGSPAKFGGKPGEKHRDPAKRQPQQQKKNNSGGADDAPPAMQQGARRSLEHRLATLSEPGATAPSTTHDSGAPPSRLTSPSDKGAASLVQQWVRHTLAQHTTHCTHTHAHTHLHITMHTRKGRAFALPAQPRLCVCCILIPTSAGSLRAQHLNAPHTPPAPMQGQRSLDEMAHGIRVGNEKFPPLSGEPTCTHFPRASHMPEAERDRMSAQQVRPPPRNVLPALAERSLEEVAHEFHNLPNDFPALSGELARAPARDTCTDTRTRTQRDECRSRVLNHLYHCMHTGMAPGGTGYALMDVPVTCPFSHTVAPQAGAHEGYICPYALMDVPVACPFSHAAAPQAGAQEHG